MQTEKYYLDGLELTLDQELFLVEVQYSDSLVRDAEHSVSQLPEWIFTPQLGIWLTRDGASIQERAIQGEAIRREMMRRWGVQETSEREPAVA